MTTTAIAVPLTEIERMAEYAYKGGLFRVKSYEQAVALMLLCQAKDMHPMEAIEEYHIIQGQHTTKVERMMAKFQAAGGKVQWHQLDETTADATFSHPQGGSVRLSWTLEMAKRAGLAGKDNWKNFPRAMLRSRVVSEGIKTVYPGAGGLTPEEAADMPSAEPERDVTPQKPATGVAALQARVAELVPQPHDVHANNLPAEPERPPLELDGTAPPTATFAEVSDQIAKAVKAHDTDALMMAVDLMRSVPDEQQRAELDVEARAAWKAIKRKPEQAKAEAYQAATRG